MTRKTFVEQLIDKIVIASLIATFSMAILFSYNLYSKSFDAAREQSRNFSSFALKSKDMILSSAAEVEVGLNALYYVFKEQIDKDLVFKMYSNLVQLNSAINVLAGFKPRDADGRSAFPESVKHAQSFNVQLRALVVRYDPKIKKLDADNLNLKDELTKIDKEESQFVIAFNSELAEALAGEFKQFYDAYYSAVPWYGQPTFLFILSALTLVVCLLVYLLLPATSPPAPVTIIQATLDGLVRPKSSGIPLAAREGK
jgi:hypothetical protein